MSWWVGKDRDAFNVALKEHTERVMRRPAPIPPAPIAAPPESAPPAPVDSAAPIAPPDQAAPVDTAPAGVPTSKQARYRAANIAKGLCARCGRPRTNYAQTCNACQAKRVAGVQRRRGFHAWRPGSRGAIPKALKPIIETAEGFRRAVLAADEALSDPALQRAAIIMVVGFLFRQRLDWIVGWTCFSKAECQRVARRLREAGIWQPNGRIAVEWMDVVMRPRAAKREAWKANVAFWLDVSVAKGDVTRETRDGAFFYGLPTWE